MSTVVFPGSFDPFTLGHLDLVRRARAMYDTVIVLVSHNPSKRTLLSIEQRCEAIRETIATDDHTPGQTMGEVSVRILPTGLLVDFCQQVGAVAVVKGLRSQIDLAYEEPMARMNRRLTGLETVFLLTDPAHAHLSSSLVREVAQLGGDVSDMLPAPSARALTAALAQQSKP
ncbi:pantetheine-phosphate adenylyltransferase [Devriesea agamarum]|uniref:pantetheine-phosphate adenylyltransferase n=1 Tax=Devriesea agamarum TaxID=472569 RepID=UPI00071D4EE1|nr:pantetheine-phosphate adenylyltransferase [Devriesea agamarum]